MPPDRLAEYIARQVYHTFPDKQVDVNEIRSFVTAALDRVEFCFSRINNKYFSKEGQTYFNHLHSDQYSMFLYLLANSIWRMEGEIALAERIYYLNKNLHAIDTFYRIQLPDIFLFVHSVGTVLGHAHYSNYFVVYQGCTVGGKSGIYPEIEQGVVMYNRSMLIGKCRIGNNCSIAPGAILIDMEVSEDRVVFGRHPNVESKPVGESVMQRFFCEPDR